MSETLFDTEPPMRRSAVLSSDGAYRYELGRRWSDDETTATFVMLNPSIADADIDDPTIRRCIGFAKSWGMGGLCVVNLYALRSTDPKALWRCPDPVGPLADDYLAHHASTADAAGWPLVAAWGANAKPERVAEVLRLPGMGALSSLGVTKDGAPRHPLYLKSDAARRSWPTDGAA